LVLGLGLPNSQTGTELSNIPSNTLSPATAHQGTNPNTRVLDHLAAVSRPFALLVAWSTLVKCDCETRLAPALRCSARSALMAQRPPSCPRSVAPRLYLRSPAVPSSHASASQPPTLAGLPSRRHPALVGLHSLLRACVALSPRRAVLTARAPRRRWFPRTPGKAAQVQVTSSLSCSVPSVKTETEPKEPIPNLLGS
jgi:hypothetical protein